MGWYELQRPRHTEIIPVFKVNGTYYTVSWPGAEVPLEPCPHGLEWAVTPSSMAGTTIIYDERAENPYFISVKDAWRPYEGPEGTDWLGRGEKRQLVKIDKPSWVPDCVAQPPSAIEDFLGWYRFGWAPGLMIEIRKDGTKYLVYMEPDEEPVEIQLLSQRLGFTWFVNVSPKKKIELIYDDSRKRFELTIEDPDVSPPIMRIPLKHIQPPSSSEQEEFSIPFERAILGVPSYRG